MLALMIVSAATAADAAEAVVNVARLDPQNEFRLKDLFRRPIVSEKYEYYEVRGNSEQELRCQLTENGCLWRDGKKYDSVTTWFVTWDYDYRTTPGGYKADSFKTTVQIVFRFPKWVRTNGAPQPLVANWDNYLRNLTTHETGHRDLAVEAAAELAQFVDELPPAPSKDALDRTIQAVCLKRIEKLNADQKAYDDVTVHGATQGAYFR